MSSITSLTVTTSLSVQIVTFGSLITTNVTVPTIPATPTSTTTNVPSISARIGSQSPRTTTMSSTTSTPSPTPSRSSGLSRGASIGIGVGLAVGVLALICGLLWFFSFHKRYQEDSDEVEIGPNATDYRRKASINALDSNPPTEHDKVVGIQHARTASMKSNHRQPELERPMAPTPGSRGKDVGEQMRRDGFF